MVSIQVMGNGKWVMIYEKNHCLTRLCNPVIKRETLSSKEKISFSFFK